MSQYELMSLWFQIVSNLQTSMANYFAGVFGMLGVAYFVSHKLDRVASWLLVGLYTLFCLGMFSELYELGRTLNRLAAVVQKFAANGSGLEWHAAARGQTFRHIPLAIVGMVWLIYAATLVFYFRARKHRDVGFARAEEVID